jgi:uncharacterized protein YdeI (YjbR/CyaY-like superfamily)
MKAGKMTTAGLAIVEEAKTNGSWNNAHTSQKPYKIPSDLKRALVVDRKAWDNFQNFANSYRNMYVHWIMNAKTDGTRRKRIEKVVRQASQNRQLISS